MVLGSWVGECRDLFGILPWSRVELWFEKVWAGIRDIGGSWSWAQIYKGWSQALGCTPHVGEVQHVQLRQLWLTSGHPGALTYGLHPTHSYSAAQTNSWAAKKSLVHRWPIPQSGQKLAARDSCFPLVQQNSHLLSQQQRASLKPAHTGRLTTAKCEPAST